MPPIHTQTLSHRNVKRGKRCYGKGYRRNGLLYIQLKRVWASFSRQFQINENEYMTELINELWNEVYSEDIELPDDLHFEFWAKGSMLEESEDMVKTVLDGGETVSARVYDNEGTEWIEGLRGWEPKVKGRRAPDAKDRLRFMADGEEEY